MSYEFPVDAAALYGERRPQFVNQGLPAADLDEAMSRVGDVWSDQPGGWTREFSDLAARYADAGEHYLSALAFGVARFPTLADEAKRQAMTLQIEQYAKAAPTFPVAFERRVLDIPYLGGTTPVPVHILSASAERSARPVVILSGGLDTWKVDMHAMAVAFVQTADVAVMAFDHPGTGETAAPLDGHALDVIDGLIAAARELGDGRVAHAGFSFGANLSGSSGLRGVVDAAIDLGGPMVASFTPANFEHLMFGMRDIAGNAFGFDAIPTLEQLMAAVKPFDRTDLLSQDANCPMLVVNGADDVHVVREDTLVFEGRRDTEVHLIPDTGHCAASKLPEVVALMAEWLRARLV
ncbi:esterase FrsA [Catenulispora sp. GP43]|uniref:alpha/beta hydrolase family protein n=1 Tax=Catenulispora sp. GP43 TaxID=3156263 RepID=UPI00351962E3